MHGSTFALFSSSMRSKICVVGVVFLSNSSDGEVALGIYFKVIMLYITCSIHIHVGVNIFAEEWIFLLLSSPGYYYICYFFCSMKNVQNFIRLTLKTSVSDCTFCRKKMMSPTSGRRCCTRKLAARRSKVKLTAMA